MKLPTFTLRTRIFAVYLLLFGSGLYFLVARAIDDLRPRYLESMEEVLVDSAHLLASSLQSQLQDGAVDRLTADLFFQDAYVRRFQAPIYGMVKRQVSLRVYVTDATGKVVYDSEGAGEVGKDYSQWRDVARTLKGEYGARASRRNPDDERTLVLHVAAPLYRSDGAVVGVVSVGKPTASINQLVAAARRKLLLFAGGAGLLIVVVGLAFSIWIATPIARLTEYAEAVRDGRPASLPRLAGREVGTLRQAFEEMRAALDGKAYVERYVQSLTHELKSPLSAIRGAAEILEENPPEEARRRFLGNIRQETTRLQRVVDQMLQLATLEARKARAEFKRHSLDALVQEWANLFRPLAEARGITLCVEARSLSQVNVDHGLLTQAVGNLLQNALEFTPSGGVVTLSSSFDSSAGALLCIRDTGTGIPDYALPRLFERFFSLARPGDGRKGTGLGLSLVREIALLHEASVTVTNQPRGGVEARLCLPTCA